MRSKPTLLRRLSLLMACVLGGMGGATRPATAQVEIPGTSHGWTLDEAMDQLRMYPDDAYLQYVALQLARRAGDVGGTRQKIEHLTGARRPQWQRRTAGVNLFSLFSGSLAVQESLQLETMTGEVVDPRQFRGQNRSERRSPDEIVSISDLQGPTTSSHPWTQMLAGREPETSTLAACVPEDQYYVRFRSVAKLMELLELNDTWGEHLFSQTSRKAYSSLVSDRLMAQLALQSNDLLRPFYDLVVQEMAITGSDLYVREGSDVTLLFRFGQPRVFRAQMEGFLSAAEQSRADSVRGEHQYRGIPYTFVGTPDRRVHVFAAYLKDDLHLRSNSQVGLQRVIDVMLDGGKGADLSLAQSDEFAYIRTLMPYGAAEEDGFVYLSDPFIRRLVGPELKLTERRRMLCYNHLRMIGHACALYETEHGRPPESLEELAEAQCCPGPFNEDSLACPCGGRYALSEDHHTGICSHHGRVETMVPCCEIAETAVTGTEAQMYEDFVTQYNEYWRTFFDPIAVRLTATPERYRLETIILPLINNSIYQSLAMVLGGEPTPLDAGPVPDRNIFSMAFQVDKPRLLEMSGLQPPEPREEPPVAAGVVPRTAVNQLRQLGIAMHNYHEAHSTFPPIADFGAGGKPLLSWRVKLLPYLDQQALYNEFHLDEPWDSTHNKALINRIPAVFQAPGRENPKPGTTTYVGIAGEKTVFNGSKTGVPISDVPDGLANTALIVDATEKHAVVWTKPADVKYDPKTLRNVILGRHGHDGLVVMADGAVLRVTPTVDDGDLRRAATRNDGEPFFGIFGESALPTPQRRSRGFLGLSDMGLRDVDERLAYEFLTRGLGDKIGLHVYDGEPTFDFALTQFLGQAMGSFSGRTRFDDDFIPIFLLIASLNSPVYVSLPLEDTEVTDQFLTELDKSLAVMARSNTDTGWFRIERDFYTLPVGESVTARSMSIGLGPIKWRFFWARLGDRLYVASKPEVLQDLAALHEAGGGPAAAAGGRVSSAAAAAGGGVSSAANGPGADGRVSSAAAAGGRVSSAANGPGADGGVSSAAAAGGGVSSAAAPGGGVSSAANGPGDGDSAAHAMVRIRPENWNQMLPNFQLGWAESHRLACLNNVGRMSSLARLVAAGGGDLESRARQLYGVDFFCPCGGAYHADDDHHAACSVHGSAHHPQQRQIGNTSGSIDELLQEFAGLTLTLTFLEDGLHATLNVDRN